jgi:hypothetical protein
LWRENQRLRQDVDVLKRATAFFVKEFPQVSNTVGFCSIATGTPVMALPAGPPTPTLAPRRAR